MNFKKDLLLLDLETTGLDPARHEIIQIAAVLLDKETLQEKSAFSSYVKPIHWKVKDPESMKVNNITFDRVKNAPPLKDAIKDLADLMKKPVILANYGGILDNVFLQAAYRKLKLPYPFDYHTLNIWSFAFPYAAKHNLLNSKKRYTGFGMDTLIEHFKIEVEGTLHDALTDCRTEAAILRHLVTRIR